MGRIGAAENLRVDICRAMDKCNFRNWKFENPQIQVAINSIVNVTFMNSAVYAHLGSVTSELQARKLVISTLQFEYGGFHQIQRVTMAAQRIRVQCHRAGHLAQRPGLELDMRGTGNLGIQLSIISKCTVHADQNWLKVKMPGIDINT